MKYLWVTAFLLLLVFQDLHAEEKHGNDFRAALNGFIEEALQKNPILLEANNKIKVFKEIPPQVGSLDDPMLQLGLMNIPVDSFSFSSQAMTQKQLTVTQKFPYPGKLGLKVQAANEDVKIAGENLADLKLKIIKDVKISFLEYCFLKAATETTQRNKTLLEQFITIAESKYSVGKGIQQDVLKAQVERSKIMDRLIELKEKMDIEMGKLNNLMDRHPQTPLNIPHGLRQTKIFLSMEKLQSIAEENRPFLKGLRASIEKYKIKKQLAEKEYYPDFNVGFRYGQRQDSLIMEHPDFVSAFVGINIPLWYETKQSRKVNEEFFKIEVAREAYHKGKNRINLQIKTLLDQMQKSSKLVQLIRKGIIPQAKQSLESALAGYTVDKVDFLTLLDNQVTLLNWEIKDHRELTNYEQNLARLENVIGQRIY
jgi:outer membrane protein TolC